MRITQHSKCEQTSRHTRGVIAGKKNVYVGKDELHACHQLTRVTSFLPVFAVYNYRYYVYPCGVSWITLISCIKLNINETKYYFQYNI